jgi:hypothetical protein
MGFSQRLKAAVKGSRELRAMLIRDPNKMISASVLSSPKLTENEVEAFSKMANVSEDILRIIASNRRWMKNYGVVVGLCRNPKTPLAMSLNCRCSRSIATFRSRCGSPRARRSSRPRQANDELPQLRRADGAVRSTTLLFLRPLRDIRVPRTLRPGGRPGSGTRGRCRGVPVVPGAAGEGAARWTPCRPVLRTVSRRPPRARRLCDRCRGPAGAGRGPRLTAGGARSERALVWLDFGELKQIEEAPGQDRGPRDVINLLGNILSD